MATSDISKVFKALSDENRLRILEALQSGEKCACVLLDSLRIGQPTLSHHMRILADSGLVNVRRSGKSSYCSIAPAALLGAADYLAGLSKTTGELVVDESDCRCR